MNELKTFAQRVVERATEAGATAAEVYARHGFETEIQVRNGEIETLQEGSPRSVGLRLWHRDRSASTYATDFSDAAITRLIRDTLDLVELTDPEPEAALPPRSAMVTEAVDLDLFDPALAEFTAEQKLALARRTEQAAMSADPRITTSGGASYGDVVMSHAIANSEGVALAYRGSFASFSVEVIADDEGGKKRNGSWWSMARHIRDLADAESVGRRAGQRAVAQLGAGPIPTGAMPVVFDPIAGSALLGLLFGVLTGGAIERRASYLVERMGQVIASPLFSLLDDPKRPRGIGSRPFDGELMAARNTVFVENGVLKSWALNHYSARKLGLAPTGHASRPASGRPGETASNLYMAAGTTPAGALLAGIERGFYCTATMGFGFNAATGDFSRGASGFLIENGVLTRPVSEVTVSANFNDLFGRIDAVGDDLEFTRSVNCPSFRVSQMVVAGR